MRISPIVTLIVFFIAFGISKPVSGQAYNIVPMPAKMLSQPGNFEITPATSVYINKPTPELINIAAYLQTKMKTATGLDLTVTTSPITENVISFTVDSLQNTPPEGYSLIITTTSVKILSRTPTGAFYALQTLFQLLPPGIESRAVLSENWIVPCVIIKDFPRFTYRGLHMDVCRHFFTLDVIKRQLDIMAIYKLNTFHWHLTDDQGWRIEIKKYPRLTEVGSFRTEADGTTYGGFYTQEQIKDVIRYARERYINVLPEIEMPGHALAALASYPEYSCTGGPFTVKNIWGIELEAFCAGNDETFHFIEDIIKEIASLFPYEYIHIGGDECMKTRWKVCPLCQKRMRNEKLKNEKQLQSYFIKRVAKIVNAHGKKIIGWDEILEGGLASSATVMSWRGEKGGIIAAKKRQNVIMTPQKWMYLDHYQGTDKLEPAALRGLVTLEDLYNYEPVPKKLTPDRYRYILGTQANLWAEYIAKPEHLEYMAYPRSIALSEVAWTLRKNKNFSDFISRMDNQYKRLDLLGVNYHIPLPEGPCNLEVFTDTLKLNFSTSRPVKLIYTTDSTTPDASSKLFEGPLMITSNTLIKIRSMLPTGAMSIVRNIHAAKQNFFPQTTSPGLPGLTMKIIPGNFYRLSDVNLLLTSRDTIINNLNFKFDYKDPCAAIISGYIDVPEKAKYYFSSESDQLSIDGNVVVSNEGEIKNHSRNDGSIMLMPGKHALRIIFFNNIIGGRPAAINGIKTSYKTEAQEKFVPVNAALLSH